MSTRGSRDAAGCDRRRLAGVAGRPAIAAVSVWGVPTGRTSRGRGCRSALPRIGVSVQSEVATVHGKDDALGD